MKILGLTGGIASGKSTVSRILKDLGAVIIDADELARKVVEPSSPVLEKLAARFGADIITPTGALDREALSRKTFGNLEAIAALNSITHPAIAFEIRDGIEKAEAENARVVVIDAPVLFEAGMQAWIKPVVLVSSDTETQIRRMISRNGFTREEAEARVRSQMPLEEKLKLADYVLENTGSLRELEDKVKSLWPVLTRES